MLDLLLPTYNFALSYAQKLVADIPDDQLTAQPVPGRTLNHPAFLLGHLAWAKDNMLATLGQAPTLPPKWKELFSVGQSPQPDRSLYPSKAELLQALEGAHARLLAAAQAATEDQLAQPAPERMRARFPNVATMLAGLMVGHFTNHIGQLSAWRRAMGYPSVF